MSEALRMGPEKITAHGFGWHYAPPFGRSPRSLRGLVSYGPATSPTRKAVFAVLGPLWPVQPPHLPNRELVKSDTGARRKLGVARLGHCSEHVVKLPLHGLGKLRISACLRGQQHFDGRFNGHCSGLHLEESRSDQTAEIGKFGVIHELLPSGNSPALFQSWLPSQCERSS